MKDEEHRLIIQAKEGDVEAFAQLVAPYEGWVCWVGRGRTE